tara:strand:- start:6 stop:287 length:282 start_codon:yes stop_codon:yes gene_type:complete
MSELIKHYSGTVQQHNTDLDTLEEIIDRDGIASVVDMLAEICSAKADHIQSNYAIAYDHYDENAIEMDNIAALLIGAAHAIRNGDFPKKPEDV